jgi:hypothetical protein
MPSNTSIGLVMVVGFLVVGTLVSWVLSKSPTYTRRFRVAPGAVAGSRPPPLGARQGPGVMSMNVVGLLHFKSAAAKAGIIPGVVVAIGGAIGGVGAIVGPAAIGGVQTGLQVAVPAIAGGLLVAFLAYLRPKGAVQSCYVDQNGAITLMRGDVQFPFDFTHYRYVRMDCSSTNTYGFGSGPQMLVLYRDKPPNFVNRWGSIWFPRVNDERAVLFFHGWRTAEGYFVGGYDLAALFYQACVRAGRTPVELDHFFAKPSWEVRPNS